MSDHDDTDFSVVERVDPTPFQQEVLDIPEEWNVLLDGGRGGGKSKAMQLAILRHVVKYARKAKVLYIRETLKSLTEFEDELHSLFVQAFNVRFQHNRQEHTFHLPNGAYVELGQLQTEEDYSKYQGRSFTLLLGDEYGAMITTKWFWLLSSNLRSGDKRIPTRIILAANPGGAQHGHIQVDFIGKGGQWEPYNKENDPDEPENTWINVPSTYLDNPHLDPIKYIRNLRQACGNDEELLQAWISGDWNIARGAYFAGALDEKIHMLHVHPHDQSLIALTCEWPVTEIWCPFLAHDWGSAVPSVTYVVAESPGVEGFPKGSAILVDELATNDWRHSSNDVGLHWPPNKLAEGMHDLRKPWNCPASGVGDDAAGLEQSLLMSLAEYGVYLRKPRKERVSGWQAMRRLLTATKNRSGEPGLWISARCRYFWLTVPYLMRDPKRPEDLMTKSPDHGADAARYGVMNLGNHVHTGGVIDG